MNINFSVHWMKLELYICLSFLCIISQIDAIENFNLAQMFLLQKYEYGFFIDILENWNTCTTGICVLCNEWPVLLCLKAKFKFYISDICLLCKDSTILKIIVFFQNLWKYTWNSHLKCLFLKFAKKYYYLKEFLRN